LIERGASGERRGWIGREGEGNDRRRRNVAKLESRLCMPLDLLAAIRSICISVGHFCVVISSVAFIYKPILILTRCIRQIAPQKCVIMTCLSSEIEKKIRNLMG